MMKFLFPQLKWDCIKIVGFDMDGTLYDELEFISQVYKPIAVKLTETCQANYDEIYSWMVARWLEKGSSYNRIFDEVLQKYNLDEQKREETVLECVRIYRNYKPKLVITERVKWLLDFFKAKYEIFLISDGNYKLQLAKYEALGLERWFATENVAISGLYGSEYSKPSTLIINKIRILKEINPECVVYIGDREFDKEFAKNAGFRFLEVYNMLR